MLGLGPFGSVPLQRSVNYRTVNIMFTHVRVTVVVVDELGGSSLRATKDVKHHAKSI